MPKFVVTIEEVVRHTIEMEADDEAQAGADAINTLVQAGEEAFNTEVCERGVFLVLPKVA